MGSCQIESKPYRTNYFKLAYFQNKVTPDRYAKSLLIVLSGIEGTGVWSSNVASGISAAGYPGAIEVHEWGTGNKLRYLTHLCDLERNNLEARKLAEKICQYQDLYPDRPVQIVGHSGGAGIALLTLEALPQDRKVDAVILLAAAVSPDHNLDVALSRTTHGIWNFRSLGDFPLLVVGTSLVGNIDRDYGISAGAIGFRHSSHWTQSLLHERPYQLSMLRHFNLGGHFGWTTRSFARHQLAPILMNLARNSST